LEENRGEQLQARSASHKRESEKSVSTLDAEITSEQGKLAEVQAEIEDWETKLVQKRAEEKALEELLAHQTEQREKYKVDQEKAFAEISSHITSNRTQLDYHNKSLECLKKFSTDVSYLLDNEINDTLMKTRDVLVELEKEVTFLEEKMASYERSFSLFSAADEPEVLDGLKKLFIRSAAIYVESKQSVSRVKSVAGLLHTVLTQQTRVEKELKGLADIEHVLDKIVNRQVSLNEKYKLQK